MATTLDPLGIRRRLGRSLWFPPDPFGPDGWKFDARDDARRIIVSAAPAPDDVDGTGGDWWHASISAPVMPTYDDLQMMHRAVWPDGYAYQVFAPPAEHVNIHVHALHLWGRPNGARLLPAFGMHGTI
jgi:hypothetical protein